MPQKQTRYDLEGPDPWSRGRRFLVIGVLLYAVVADIASGGEIRSRLDYDAGCETCKPANISSILSAPILDRADPAPRWTRSVIYVPGASGLPDATRERDVILTLLNIEQEEECNVLGVRPFRGPLGFVGGAEVYCELPPTPGVRLGR